MIKLKRAAKRLIKNKKGFTLIEAIAVVAIIGILSVVTGSLIASGTKSYVRQKENAAAKELSVIIAKEIERNLAGAKTVFLQDLSAVSDSSAVDYTLPVASFVVGEGANAVTYTISNPPFGSVNPFYFYQQNGQFMYYDGEGEPYSYFAEDAEEKRAFYGDYTAQIYFKAVLDGNGHYNAVLIFVDIYKGTSRKYESTGRLVKFREASVSSDSIVYSYVANNGTDYITNVESTGSNSYKAEYQNAVNSTKQYTVLYFAK